MSTDEDEGRTERIVAFRRRREPVLLPADPTDEELARDWTLSEADGTQVLRCRGDAHRLWFAIQLCVLRRSGRFVDPSQGAPGRIVSHLCGQIGLEPLLFLQPLERQATLLEYEQQIRCHLGYQSFDEEAQRRLDAWLYDRAAEGVSTVELFDRAEAVLGRWKIELPAPSTLERLASAAAVRARQETFARLTAGLSPALCQSIDQLLDVRDGDHRSTLFFLKEYPPEPTPATITTYIERMRLLETIGVGGIDLSGVPRHQVEHWAQLVKRYEAWDLRRYAPVKRYAMVACFLAETQKTILDHLVAMNDKYLTGVHRRARKACEKEYREIRSRSRRSLEMVLAAVEILLPENRPIEALVADLQAIADRPSLRSAVEICRKLHRLDDRGVIDHLRSRYSQLRRYWPAFLELPFKTEPGSTALFEAIQLARGLNTHEHGKLPDDAPMDFVLKDWKGALVKEDGHIDRALWEISLALAVRDALRSGDIFLSASRRHVSVANLLYDQTRWAEDREQVYVELVLPEEATQALDRLRQMFHETASAADCGMSQNPFAEIHDGQLHVGRRDALHIPDSVRELRRVIETSLPRIRIEHLLAEVDAWTGFTKAFQPLADYSVREENMGPALLATLVAHGTNLGISSMGHSAEGVSVHQLQRASRWFLREETIKAANAVIVNYHHQLTFSSMWGDGTTSSSDGQRFSVRASSLSASYYPRYFGYYDRAVSIVTHTSDQHSVFGTQVISCAPREAQYVLDGLLQNNTVLRPREHYTDTHGYTEHIFGLCYLLGITFAPRLKDLTDQQLYKLDRDASYPSLDLLFHGSADVGLILEQWDELVRVAASLRRRTAPPHVIVQRLVGGSPSNRLARALTALGRILKTVHILKYIQDEGLRARVQLQLNRGESRHALARWLFFALQGEFQRGDYEEIMNKASCLSLLSNAVLVWNTVQMERIVSGIRATGQGVSDKDLARISPLAHAHVIPNGTYHFDRPVRGAHQRGGESP